MLILREMTGKPPSTRLDELNILCLNVCGNVAATRQNCLLPRDARRRRSVPKAAARPCHDLRSLDPVPLASVSRARTTIPALTDKLNRNVKP